MLNNADRFLKSLPAQFDGQFHWDFLCSAFARGIRPMDFDGVVEVNNRFLVFETKAPGTPIVAAQETALSRAVRLGYFTVLHVEGKSDEAIRDFYVWSLKDGQVIRRRGGRGAQMLWMYCHSWFEWADGLHKKGDLKGLRFDTCQCCGNAVNGFHID